MRGTGFPPTVAKSNCRTDGAATISLRLLHECYPRSPCKPSTSPRNPVAIDAFKTEPPEVDHTLEAKHVDLQDEDQRKNKHVAASAFEAEPPNRDNAKRGVNSLAEEQKAAANISSSAATTVRHTCPGKDKY